MIQFDEIPYIKYTLVFMWKNASPTHTPRIDMDQTHEGKTIKLSTEENLAEETRV